LGDDFRILEAIGGRNHHEPLTSSDTWPYDFLKRHSDEIAFALALPQEESKMNLTKGITQEHVHKLIGFGSNVHTELVFTMDEVGSEEWSDRKPKNVLTPAVRAEKTGSYQVKRGEQRVSAIVNTSVAGDMPPSLLTIR
jgi:hypothetical protein